MPLLRLLARTLTGGPVTQDSPPASADALRQLGEKLGGAARAKLGRSLRIREVDAGSCNGCELEIHALNSPVYDLESYGIGFVASPRHADVLLVAGVVTTNMAEALRRTWDAMPGPKWLVAMGDCAACGGLFADSPAVLGGAAAVLPVDLTIPGCPPTPEQLLSGFLALLEG